MGDEAWGEGAGFWGLKGGTRAEGSEVERVDNMWVDTRIRLMWGRGARERASNERCTRLPLIPSLVWRRGGGWVRGT